MKLITYSIIILLLISINISGCMDFNGSNDNEKALQSVPRSASNFVFIDVEKMRDDSNLDDAYDSIDDSYLTKLKSELRISKKDVKYLVTFGGCMIVNGIFDLQDIEDELDDKDYKDDEYSDVITMNKYNYYGHDYVGLFDKNTLILSESESTLEDAIDTIQGDKKSLQDDDDFIKVLSKLSGFHISIYESSYSSYDELEIVGSSVAKKNDEELILTFVYKFDTDDDADDSIDDIEDDFEDYIDNYHGDVDKVSRKGDIVVAKGTVEINDYY